MPGIFRAEDPANRVAFAPEDRSRLEAVLEGLPASLFSADDALGWVYQFWQSERKDEVNKRGDKIGGADLAPVTQLFTEHYMVRFLLENSLGAWWAGRHPDSPLLREWEYLRFQDDRKPATGTFEGWPEHAAEVTVMDPCCGSGHFLVAAADMLRQMRMEEDGLTPGQAAIAVLRDNLFGLELDARCLQLAAFNLALDAWKVGGYQPLPIPNLACTGIAIKGQRADWQRLAGRDTNMSEALDRLHDLFQDAPELGSLIDPRAAAGEGLWAVDVDDLLARLDQALRREAASDPAAAVFGAAAAGTAKAAQLLARRYWLVTTNPPFLGRGHHGPVLANFADRAYKHGRADLATILLLRSLEMSHTNGHVAVVTPQNWLFLGRYQQIRQRLLEDAEWRVVVRIGEHGFQSTAAAGAFVALVVISRRHPTSASQLALLDVGSGTTPADKQAALRSSAISVVSQSDERGNPDAIVTFEIGGGRTTLGDYATAWQGISTSDFPRFGRGFWELPEIGNGWLRQQSTTVESKPYSGRESILYWQNGHGQITEVCQAGATFRGAAAWSRVGVAITQMRSLSATLYTGAIFDGNVAVIVPTNAERVPSIWAFALSPEFTRQVRRLNPKVNVTNSTFAKVPFDLEHWTRVAAEQYANGLPEPHSDDPTQWLFQGNVVGSEAPLQVAVARLLGYRWPDQELDALDALADADGLVPLVSVSGERPAAERLRALLGQAYGDAWSPALLERLLAEADSPGATLEAWLRDDFFAQHTKLFGQRPFIWHVWDGRRDGFSVLCHYHRLDRAKLEKLTYTLLGDWIDRQRAARDEPGAEARLNAALGLKEQLVRIIEGEALYDISVRWKSLAEQPIGWEPALDDGVRLNIRPFVTAGVLRSKVNVKWDKDRGKNPDGSERINDLHPSLAEKRAARAAAGKG